MLADYQQCVFHSPLILAIVIFFVVLTFNYKYLKTKKVYLFYDFFMIFL